jgi:hypothetical protein
MSQRGLSRGRGVRPAGRRRWRALAALAVSGVAVAGAAVAAVLLLGGGSDEADDGPPRAAIIDQLSVTVPNPEFVENARETLERAGYTIDYYPGEEVTVDFYRRLPRHGYDVLVFRSHADRLQARTREGEQFDEVILFTSEPYDRSKYVSDQAANRLVIARYEREGDPYFGIAPEFIDERIGSFDGATVIMMGCEGLLSEHTAKAFVERGARTYISWDETVSATHTDAATELLLQHLFLEGQAPAGAVAKTMDEVGPDPTFGSKLLAYPPEG